MNNVFCVFDGVDSCPEVTHEDGVYAIKKGGKVFTVSGNYASKSKLIQGDILRVMGKDETSAHEVFKVIKLGKRVFTEGTVHGEMVNGKEVITIHFGEHVYHPNPASIRFYQLEDGDTVSIMVPADKDGNPAIARSCAISSKVEHTKDPSEYEHLL